MAALLNIDGLCVGYGRKGLALNNVGLSVAQGEIVTLLGSNGAGKTTLIRSVSGTIPLHGGSVVGGQIRFDGNETTRVSADTLVRSGMSQVPEGRLVFKNLSVEDNLSVGAAVLPRGRRKE